MILKVSWNGLCTLSFGLLHNHVPGSWLVCEVTLSVGMLVTFQGGLWVSYNDRRVWEREAPLERE